MTIPVLSNPNPSPWERLDRESQLQHEHFLRFLEGPTLSVESYVQGFPEDDRPALREAARLHRWRARAKLARAAMGETMGAALLAGAEQRGALLAAGWTEALEWALSSILEHRARGLLLSPKDALSIIAAASKLADLGMPMDSDPMDLSKVSTETLEQMHAMLAREMQ